MKKIVLLTALLCLLIAVQSVFAAEPIPPKAKTNLKYDGTQQILIEEGTGVGGSQNEKFYYWNDSKDDWDDTELPRAKLPGTYTVKYILSNSGKPAKTASGYTISGIVIAEVDPPTKRTGLQYDGSLQQLVEPGKPKGTDVYYYRLANSNEDWNLDRPAVYGPGTYSVEYILLENDTYPSKSITGKVISNITIARRNTFNPSDSSGNNSGNSGSGGSNHYSFYTVGDGSALFEANNSLPATGFPIRISKPLSVKPASVSYEDLSMRIQIPSINVDVELTGVPVLGDTWAVEWLGNQAGMLSGSAMPGEGYTMVAAHNHLNTQEIGPFGFLFDLDENDRIFVNMPDGSLKMYSVYANELLEPNDFTQIASISKNEAGSLILVTCENEMIDGSYQNRRVVFAKLMN